MQRHPKEQYSELNDWKLWDALASMDRPYRITASHNFRLYSLSFHLLTYHHHETNFASVAERNWRLNACAFICLFRTKCRLLRQLNWRSVLPFFNSRTFRATRTLMRCQFSIRPIRWKIESMPIVGLIFFVRWRKSLAKKSEYDLRVRVHVLIGALTAT